MNIFSIQGSAHVVAKLGRLAVLRVGGDSFSFVQNQTLKDGSPSMQLQLVADRVFEHYTMNNADPNSDEFYMEINADEFVNLLKSATSARSLALRLVKKDTPHLQIYTKHQQGVAGAARTVSHNMPVRFIHMSRWPDFAPLAPPKNIDVIVCLPPVKQLQKVLAGFRGMSTKYLCLAANNSGELELRLETDAITLTSYFSDLTNLALSEEHRGALDGPDENEDPDKDDPKRMYTCRVELKMITPFITNQQLTSSRLMLSIVHHRFAYFTIEQDDLFMQFLVPNVLR